MKPETTQWTKSVRKALIDKDMTLKQLAEQIGYSQTTISTVVNGRYANSSYKDIAEKINNVLGTKGLPKRTNTPSDEWCQCVKIRLLEKKMSVSKLADHLNVSRDQLSLVVNGRLMNQSIIDSVNSLLDISLSEVPSGDN